MNKKLSTLFLIIVTIYAVFSTWVYLHNCATLNSQISELEKTLANSDSKNNLLQDYYSIRIAEQFYNEGYPDDVIKTEYYVTVDYRFDTMDTALAFKQLLEIK